MSNNRFPLDHSIVPLFRTVSSVKPVDENRALNELVNEIMSFVFRASEGELLSDEADLVRWKMQFMTFQNVSSVPAKMLNQRHVPLIQWAIANRWHSLKRALCKEHHDSHLRYLLFFCELAYQSAWMKNHADYIFGFVLAEQHNELMHALNGNIALLEFGLEPGNLADFDNLSPPMWRLAIAWGADFVNTLTIVDSVCTLAVRALADRWNSLMHALYGNGDYQNHQLWNNDLNFNVIEGVFYVLHGDYTRGLGLDKIHRVPLTLDEQLHIVHALVEYRALPGDFGFARYLADNWNRIMHALNGNMEGEVDNITLYTRHYRLYYGELSYLRRNVGSGRGDFQPESAYIDDFNVRYVWRVLTNIREWYEGLIGDDAVFEMYLTEDEQLYVVAQLVQFVSNNSDYSLFLKSNWNKLMHAINGNSKRGKRSNVTRAYVFDSADPHSCKFDRDDALRCVVARKQKPFVVKLGIDKVADLMMRRRGVKPALAFQLAEEAYWRTHREDSDTAIQMVRLTDVVHSAFEIKTGDEMPWSRWTNRYDGGALPADTNVSDWKKKSGVTSYLKNTFAAVTPDLTVKLDPETAGKVDETNTSFLSGTSMLSGGLEKLAGAINGAVDKASNFGANVPSLSIESLLKVVGGEYGSSPWVVRLVRLFRDIYVAWKTDGLLGAVALGSLLAETGGTVYSILITGCVAIMKQFTKWCDDSEWVKKGWSDFSLSSDVLMPIINIITKFVFGIQKQIPTINSTFTFIKNLKSPVDYLVSAVKQCVNYIWKVCTGTELFCSEEDVVLRNLKLVSNNIVAGAQQRIDHDVLAAMKSNAQTLRQLLVRLNASTVSVETKAHWNRVSKVLTEFVAGCGVEAEMVTTKKRCAVLCLYGATGVGKTSVPNLIAAALGKLRNWPGDTSNWHSSYSLSDEGFQVPLPGECKSVQIDEPFASKDSTVAAVELKNFLLFVGINPFQAEGATLDHKNDFIRVDLCTLTYNFVPNELGLHNTEAGHRRPDLKFELIATKPDPFSRLSHDHIDDIWKFRSGGRDYTFTQVVSMVDQVVSRYAEGSRNFDAVRAQLAASFEAVPVLPTQATSLFAKDDNKPSDPANAHKFSRVPFVGEKRGEPLSPANADSPVPSIRKGHVSQMVYDQMNVSITFEELNKMLAEFPPGEVDANYIHKYLDPYSPILRTDESPEQLARGLRAALGMEQDVRFPGFFRYPRTECVVRHKGGRCLIHDRPLVCAKNRLAEDEIEELPKTTYYSYLLEKGKFVCDALDETLNEYCGFGLKNAFFSILLGVVGGIAIRGVFRLLGSVCELVVGWILPDVATPKAYGNQYAVQANHSVALPRFVPLNVPNTAPAVPKSHVIYAKHGRAESMYQTLTKSSVMYNTIFSFPERMAVERAQLNLVSGRLAWTVKHGFFLDDARPRFLVLAPPYSKVLPVRDVDGYDEKFDLYVQTEFDKLRDITFVILPVGLNAAPDVSDRYITGDRFNPSLFNQAMLYYKPTLNMRVSDDLRAVECDPTKLPLLSLAVGRYVGMATVEFSDKTSTIGMEFSGGIEPPDGACGGMICPHDTHFGENYLGLALVAWSHKKQAAFATFVCREDILDFHERHPNVNRGLRIVDHTEIKFSDVTADFSKKCAIGKADRPGFLPSSAGLYQSAIFNCLAGIKFQVDGEVVTMPPTIRVPSPVRDVEAGFKKYPPYLAPLDPTCLEDLKLCAIDVANTILSAGKEYPYQRGGFLTLDEALNGTADGQVIAVNAESSAGYSPTFKGKKSNKHEFIERVQPQARWTMKVAHVSECEDVFTAFCDGVVMYYIAKTTPKGELRNPGKVTRLTSSKPFFLLIAMRRIFAPVQAFIAYGAPRNGTARGVDPTGPSGERLQQLFNTFMKKLEGDAKTFDASQLADLVNVCVPIILFMLLCFVYPRMDRRLLRRVAECAAVVNHLAYELVGALYYLHLEGNISGCLLTTDVNDFLTGICVRMAWLMFYRNQTKLNRGMWVEFHAHVRYASQGDDLGGCTDCDFDQFDLERGYARCRIRFTSSDKEKVEERYTKNLTFIKRIQAKFCGRLVGRLPLSVIHEIFSYIRTTVQGRDDATLENVQSGLLELLMYGRDAVETCLFAINEALVLAHIPTVNVTYEDLLVTWSQKFATSLSWISPSTLNLGETLLTYVDVKPDSLDAVKKSSAIYFVRSVPRLMWPRLFLSHSSGLLTRRLKKRAAQSTHNVSDSSVKIEADGSDRSVVAPPLREAKGLTLFMDGLRKVGMTNPSISANLLNSQDPYPDQQVKEILTREYPLDTFLWKTTDSETANAPIYSIQLPEQLFVIPKIAATLSAFRFISTKVKISLRINATLFTQGRLLLRYVPACTNATWRNQFVVAMQSEHALLSPSSGETAEITVPWVAPKGATDLQDIGEEGYGGIFEVYVLHPCGSASAIALPDMTVNVFASFVDPIVYGLDVTGAPAVMSAVKKSAVEAIQKVEKGITTGVSTVASIAKGGMKVVSALESIGEIMAFDKPFTVAAPQAVIPRLGNDLPATKGLANGIVLGTDPAAIVATEKGLIGNDDPHGTLLRLMRRPGILLTDAIQVGDALGSTDPYFDFPVQPNMALNFSGTLWSVNPLCYYSQFFKYWRGSIKYKLIFSASKLTSARVRVSFVPNDSILGTTATYLAGDIASAVVVINGDTEFEFMIPYLSNLLYKAVGDIGEDALDSTQAIGRIRMELVSPIATAPGNAAADIYFTLYVAAGEDFQVLQPDPWTSTQSIVLTQIPAPPPASLSFPVRKAVKKSYITNDFSKSFQGLVPSKMIVEEKICSPESVKTIVELMKRFEYTGYLQGALTTYAHFRAFPTTSWHFFLAAPFITCRGSTNWKIVKTKFPVAGTSGGVTTFSLPYCNILEVKWHVPDYGLWNDLQGKIVHDLNVSPWLEFTVPFYDQVMSREVFPVLGQMPLDPQIDFSYDNNNELNPDYFYIYMSVGDDFSLGPFVGIPHVDTAYSPAPLETKMPGRSRPNEGAAKMIAAAPQGKDVLNVGPSGRHALK